MSNKKVNPFKLKMHLLECENEEKDKQISDLKSQLAEKDKEIESLKLERDNAVSCANMFKVAIIENQNQKSIEQLEEVKESLIQNADEIGEEYKEDYFMISLGNVKSIIDQQISLLKGE